MGKAGTSTDRLSAVDGLREACVEDGDGFEVESYPQTVNIQRPGFQAVECIYKLLKINDKSRFLRYPQRKLLPTIPS